MTRVVIYFAAVALLAFGAVWLADRPGEVAITWQGRLIETSVLVLVMAFFAAAALAVVLWGAARSIVHAPDALSSYLRNRRGVRGYLAVSHGLIAVGSGDARAAKKLSDDARRIAPDEPLTLLLAAQTAQLSGDRAAAVRTFELMAERKDTRLLGLHGLFIEAQRRNDPQAALLYAEEAAKHASVPSWAGQAVLEYRCSGRDWAGALERLERNMRGGLIDKPAYRRQRAVLLTAQAVGSEETDRPRAQALALEAVRMAPELVPAAVLAGRLLGEAGEYRRAARIIEAAWKINPHPDLAETYAHLRSGTSARDRLGRIETLAAKTPGNVEAALAVARAALDAREFSVAREALAPLTVVPTRRVAALMAELEEMQHSDEGRAREWMTRALNARRDPAWTADGFVSERWLPISPVTGRLDAFEWKDPLAGEQPGALIELERHGSPRHAVAGPSAAAAEPPPAAAPVPTNESPELHKEAEPAVQAPVTAGPPARSDLTTVPLAPAVIPLTHAPDDPGPEPVRETESEPEASKAGASDNWTRIRQLFRP
ncbi:MAG: heme biosynthesis protein HemY [Xanthobacteraceae bacterium]